MLKTEQDVIHLLEFLGFLVYFVNYYMNTSFLN